MKKENIELALQLTYENLTKEDILDLLRQVKEIYEVVSPEDKYREVSLDIAKSVAKSRTISFKQWRALSTFVYFNTKPEAKFKTF